MSDMKKGQTPTKQKQVAADENFGYSDDPLSLDPVLKAELEKKELAYRWINAKTFQENYGFHRSGWKPYKREITQEKKGSLDFERGSDPEGYVRMGDLVLAVKPEEQQVRHREKLEAKRKLYSGENQQKAINEQLHEINRKSGGKLKIHEGYDDE